MRNIYKLLAKSPLMLLFSFILFNLSGTATAQSDGESFIIGEITNIPVFISEEGTISGRQGVMRATLAEMGYIEGENVTYIFDPEAFTAEGMETVAQSLVEAKPDIIIAYGTAAAQVIKEATSNTSIPVVFVGTTDPVEIGVVTSLQSPGGNLTGVGASSEAYGKQLEWLLLLDPTIERVYIPLVAESELSSDAVDNASLQAIQKFADASEIEIIAPEIPSTEPEDIEAAISELIEAEVDAIMMVVGSPNSPRFTEVSLDLGIPMTAIFPFTVTFGGTLLSYNITEDGVATQAARYVDLILRGADPNNLPVELAPNSLAINLGIAEAIGLEIPDEILEQADIIIRPVEQEQ